MEKDRAAGVASLRKTERVVVSRDGTRHATLRGLQRMERIDSLTH